jgi:hypothetical protein
MLNVDTHVLLYAVTGALKSRETRLLRATRWSVSAIVLWEIAGAHSWAGSRLTWTIPRSSGFWRAFTSGPCLVRSRTQARALTCVAIRPTT